MLPCFILKTNTFSVIKHTSLPQSSSSEASTQSVILSHLWYRSIHPPSKQTNWFSVQLLLLDDFAAAEAAAFSSSSVPDNFLGLAWDSISPSSSISDENKGLLLSVVVVVEVVVKMVSVVVAWNSNDFVINQIMLRANIVISKIVVTGNVGMFDFFYFD